MDDPVVASGKKKKGKKKRLRKRQIRKYFYKETIKNIKKRYGVNKLNKEHVEKIKEGMKSTKKESLMRRMPIIAQKLLAAKQANAPGPLPQNTFDSFMDRIQKFISSNKNSHRTTGAVNVGDQHEQTKPPEMLPNDFHYPKSKQLYGQDPPPLVPERKKPKHQPMETEDINPPVPKKGLLFAVEDDNEKYFDKYANTYKHSRFQNPESAVNKLVSNLDSKKNKTTYDDAFLHKLSSKESKRIEALVTVLDEVEDKILSRKPLMIKKIDPIDIYAKHKYNYDNIIEALSGRVNELRDIYRQLLIKNAVSPLTTSMDKQKDEMKKFYDQKKFEIDNIYKERKAIIDSKYLDENRKNTTNDPKIQKQLQDEYKLANQTLDRDLDREYKNLNENFSKDSETLENKIKKSSKQDKIKNNIIQSLNTDNQPALIIPTQAQPSIITDPIPIVEVDNKGINIKYEKILNQKIKKLYDDIIKEGQKNDNDIQSEYHTTVNRFMEYMYKQKENISKELTRLSQEPNMTNEKIQWIEQEYLKNLADEEKNTLIKMEKLFYDNLQKSSNELDHKYQKELQKISTYVDTQRQAEIQNRIPISNTPTDDIEMDTPALQISKKPIFSNAWNVYKNQLDQQPPKPKTPDPVQSVINQNPGQIITTATSVLNPVDNTVTITRDVAATPKQTDTIQQIPLSPVPTIQYAPAPPIETIQAPPLQVPLSPPPAPPRTPPVQLQLPTSPVPTIQYATVPSQTIQAPPRASVIVPPLTNDEFEDRLIRVRRRRLEEHVANAEANNLIRLDGNTQWQNNPWEIGSGPPPPGTDFTGFRTIPQYASPTASTPPSYSPAPRYDDPGIRDNQPTPPRYVSPHRPPLPPSPASSTISSAFSDYRDLIKSPLQQNASTPRPRPPPVKDTPKIATNRSVIPILRPATLPAPHPIVPKPEFTSILTDNDDEVAKIMQTHYENELELENRRKSKITPSPIPVASTSNFNTVAQKRPRERHLSDESRDEHKKIKSPDTTLSSLNTTLRNTPNETKEFNRIDDDEEDDEEFNNIKTQKDWKKYQERSRLRFTKLIDNNQPRPEIPAHELRKYTPSYHNLFLKQKGPKPTPNVLPEQYPHSRNVDSWKTLANTKYDRADNPAKLDSLFSLTDANPELLKIDRDKMFDFYTGLDKDISILKDRKNMKKHKFNNDQNKKEFISKLSTPILRQHFNDGAKISDHTIFLMKELKKDAGEIQKTLRQNINSVFWNEDKNSNKINLGNNLTETLNDYISGNRYAVPTRSSVPKGYLNHPVALDPVQKKDLQEHLETDSQVTSWSDYDTDLEDQEPFDVGLGKKRHFSSRRIGPYDYLFEELPYLIEEDLFYPTDKTLNYITDDTIDFFNQIGLGKKATRTFTPLDTATYLSHAIQKLPHNMGKVSKKLMHLPVEGKELDKFSSDYYKSLAGKHPGLYTLIENLHHNLKSHLSLHVDPSKKNLKINYHCPLNKRQFEIETDDHVDDLPDLLTDKYISKDAILNQVIQGIKQTHPLYSVLVDLPEPGLVNYYNV
jgi:hypothetical protein